MCHLYYLRHRIIKVVFKYGDATSSQSGAIYLLYEKYTLFLFTFTLTQFLRLATICKHRNRCFNLFMFYNFLSKQKFIKQTNITCIILSALLPKIVSSSTLNTRSEQTYNYASNCLNKNPVQAKNSLAPTKG